MIETILKVLGWLTIVVGGVFGSLMLFEGAFAAANFLACLGVGIVELGLAKVLELSAENQSKLREIQSKLSTETDRPSSGFRGSSDAIVFDKDGNQHNAKDWFAQNPPTEEASAPDWRQQAQDARDDISNK